MTDKPTPVEQRDRELFIRIGEREGWSIATDEDEEIREGWYDDDPTMQDLARHRIETLSQPGTQAGEIDDAIKGLCEIHARLLAEISEAQQQNFPAAVWTERQAWSDCGALISAIVELERAKAATPSKGEIEALREAENPCAKIFDHKWLDPECVETGCQSLLPRRLADEIDVMEPPDGFDAHTPSYNAGFARARKTAVDMLRQALSLPKGEMGS